MTLEIPKKTLCHIYSEDLVRSAERIGVKIESDLADVANRVFIPYAKSDDQNFYTKRQHVQAYLRVIGIKGELEPHTHANIMFLGIKLNGQSRVGGLNSETQYIEELADCERAIREFAALISAQKKQPAPAL